MPRAIAWQMVRCAAVMFFAAACVEGRTSQAAEPSPAGRPPNIVFILADDK
jgi:hypothetical protein